MFQGRAILVVSSMKMVGEETIPPHASFVNEINVVLLARPHGDERVRCKAEIRLEVDMGTGSSARSGVALAQAVEGMAIFEEQIRISNDTNLCPRSDVCRCFRVGATTRLLTIPLVIVTKEWKRDAA